MTITLLTDSHGNKMGKTAGNAVWLDPNKTSPYDFYQYWRNVDDSDVMKCLRMLTFIPIEELEEMEHWEDNRINEKKEVLAHHLTALVHGEEEADRAQAAARSLFTGGGDDANMPTTAVSMEGDTISLIDVMIACGLGTSRGEIRRLIQQGGVSVDGEKVSDIDFLLTREQLTEGVVIKKGKKVFHKATL